MNIPHEEQVDFARYMLPLIEAAKTSEEMDNLHSIAALALKWSGFDDNGIMFSLSEYTYELAQLLRGKADNGWKDEAKQSLIAQITAQE